MFVIMKTNIYLVTILALFFLNVSEQADCTQEQIPQICQPFENIDVNRVYLCENSQDKKIYLEMFYCEDCSNLYFRLDGVFIEECLFAEFQEPPSDSCMNLNKYQCNFEENLYNKICEDNQPF